MKHEILIDFKDQQVVRFQRFYKVNFSIYEIIHQIVLHIIITAQQEGIINETIQMIFMPHLIHM